MLKGLQLVENMVYFDLCFGQSREGCTKEDCSCKSRLKQAPSNLEIQSYGNFDFLISFICCEIRTVKIQVKSIEAHIALMEIV